MALNERCKPVTLPTELVQELWSEIKSARDEAASQWREGQQREVRLRELLCKMQDHGMSEWLPTLEEVQAAFKDETDGGG